MPSSRHAVSHAVSHAVLCVVTHAVIPTGSLVHLCMLLNRYSPLWNCLFACHHPIRGRSCPVDWFLERAPTRSSRCCSLRRILPAEWREHRELEKRGFYVKNLLAFGEKRYVWQKSCKEREPRKRSTKKARPEKGQVIHSDCCQGRLTTERFSGKRATARS